MSAAAGIVVEEKQLGGQVPVAAGTEAEERQLGVQMPVAAGIEVEERQREVQSSGMFASRTRWETVP
jgi:hypothetical protein